MQRKIASSLIIVAYCFNSLPVLAAPFPGSIEEAFKDLSKGIAAYGTPKEKKRFNRDLECETQGRPIWYLEDNSKKIFSLVMLPGYVTEASNVVMGHIFTRENTPSRSYKLFSGNMTTVFHAMYKDEKDPGCALFMKNLGGHKIWYDKIRSIDQMVDDLKLQIDDLISDPGIEPILSRDVTPSKDGEEDLMYAYLRLIPSNLRPVVPGLVSFEIGRFGLSFQEFQSKTAGLSENLLAASYVPSQGTLFALLTKEGCIPFERRVGNSLSGIGGVRSEFLENLSSGKNLETILSEKRSSFSGKMDCYFGDLRNIFGVPSQHSHIGTRLNSSLIGGSSSLPVEQEAAATVSYMVGDGAVGGVFSTQGHTCEPSYTEDNSLLPSTQVSHVIPDNNLSHYIGIGALAVGAGALVIGGISAIYHWWKAKKPSWNEAYGDVVYSKTECEKLGSDDGSQVAVPVAQL